MSGDEIKCLKVENQPLNPKDFEYVKRLLEPFDDIVVEKFTLEKSKIFAIVAICLVLFLNFPKIREKSGLSEYVLWLISAVVLFGVLL